MTKPLRSVANPAVVGPASLVTDGPTKQRITLTADGRPAVVATKTGSVGVLDRVKIVYKFIIVFVGALVAFGNEVLPITASLEGSWKTWITGAVLFLTSLLTFLKANEHWVDVP